MRESLHTGAGRIASVMLSDGRFPSGGHAHSAGMEQALASGAVRDLDGVTGWAEGVLWSSALTAAGLAASACMLAERSWDAALCAEWENLDAEADARTPSPAQRATARRLGRQLLRTARQVWTSELLDRLAMWWPDGLHRPVAFGVSMSVAGGSPSDAAIGEAYGAVAVPVVAGVRLLNLDPVSSTAVLARLAPAMESVAAGATSAARTASTAADGRSSLPARSAPIADLCAELHATREATLFAS